MKIEKSSKEALIIFLSFALHASITGGIFSRLPELQFELGISEGIYGLVLFSIPLGIFLGSLIVPILYQKISPNLLICIGLIVISFFQIIVGTSSDTITLALFLFLFGFGFSFVNVSINVVSTDFENTYKKFITSQCHGWWALSFLAASLVSAILVNFQVSPLLQFSCHSIPILLGTYLIFRFVPRDYVPVKAQAVQKLTIPNNEVLLIGLWAFSGILLEATTRGWIVIYTRDLLRAPENIAVLALPTIVFTQTLGRFVLDALITKFGILIVARASSAFLLIGIILAVATNNLLMAFSGFLLIGLGISIAMPQGYAAAARVKARSPSENVAAFSTLSTVLFFIGPPIFGFMAETIGLRIAFMLAIPLTILSFYQVKRL